MPIECFPLTYNLNGFRSRINRLCFSLFVLLFLVTPCLAWSESQLKRKEKKDYIQLPLLTPNIMTLEKAASIPEEDLHNIDDRDLRKKHIMRCKEAVWRRWQLEYLKALRERHHEKESK